MRNAAATRCLRPAPLGQGNHLARDRNHDRVWRRPEQPRRKHGARLPDARETSSWRPHHAWSNARLLLTRDHESARPLPGRTAERAAFIYPRSAVGRIVSTRVARSLPAAEVEQPDVTACHGPPRSRLARRVVRIAAQIWRHGSSGGGRCPAGLTGPDGRTEDAASEPEDPPGGPELAEASPTGCLGTPRSDRLEASPFRFGNTALSCAPTSLRPTVEWLARRRDWSEERGGVPVPRRSRGGEPKELRRAPELPACRFYGQMTTPIADARGSPTSQLGDPLRRRVIAPAGRASGTSLRPGCRFRLMATPRAAGTGNPHVMAPGAQ